MDLMNTNTDTTTRWRRRQIGPVGATARVFGGIGFLAIALVARDPTWGDVAVGLGLLPAATVGLLAWRARHHAEALAATGPVEHLANVAVFVVLASIPATAGGAFLFYGLAMLVAAATRSSGCEVTTIANLMLGRDDQVGCVPFGPIDAAEAAASSSR